MTMWKSLSLAAAVLVLPLSPSVAQNPVTEAAQDILNAADWQELTEARIDAVKAALQLTPEQAKLWPAVEDAIRARGQGRYLRLQALAANTASKVDPIQLLRTRAQSLAQRSKELEALAAAWQPLYQTLEPSQKMRLRVLAVYALREMRDGLESQRLEHLDEDDFAF
jgi:hypothetical protein